MGKIWSKEEINYLIKNYSNTTNEILSKNMNRTKSSIIKKSTILNLKKSKNHKSKIIGLRNKKIGRDLTFENLKKIAKNYKTRGEFQRCDPSAYTISRVKGYLDDICNHMIKSRYSIPQMILGEIIKIIISKDIIYNDRKIIKPYELDIYIPEYNLAFEYDGKRWHNNNKNDEIKNNICQENKIKLIRIKENNRNYIKDIKDQLIDNIHIINEYCNMNIKKNHIKNIKNNILYDFVNNNVLDDKNIKNIINQYDNYDIFRKNDNYLYNKLLKTKTIEKYTKDLKKIRIKWTDEKIDDEISRYEYLNDFIKNSQHCYLYLMKNNLKYKLNKLKRKNISWSIDKIKDIILNNNIKTIYKLKKLYPGCINYLKKTNNINNIKKYMEEL